MTSLPLAPSTNTNETVVGAEHADHDGVAVLHRLFRGEGDVDAAEQLVPVLGINPDQMLLGGHDGQ